MLSGAYFSMALFPHILIKKIFYLALCLCTIFPGDALRAEIDPKTGYPITYKIDPKTGLKVDSITGVPLDPQPFDDAPSGAPQDASTPPALTTPTTTSSDAGLSDGALAGISMGALAGVAGLAVGAKKLLNRSAKKQDAATTVDDLETDTDEGSADTTSRVKKAPKITDAPEDPTVATEDGTTPAQRQIIEKKPQSADAAEEPESGAAAEGDTALDDESAIETPAPKKTKTATEIELETAKANYAESKKTHAQALKDLDSKATEIKKLEDQLAQQKALLGKKNGLFRTITPGKLTEATAEITRIKNALAEKKNEFKTLTEQESTAKTKLTQDQKAQISLAAVVKKEQKITARKQDLEKAAASKTAAFKAQIQETAAALTREKALKTAREANEEEASLPDVAKRIAEHTAAIKKLEKALAQQQQALEAHTEETQRRLTTPETDQPGFFARAKAKAQTYFEQRRALKAIAAPAPAAETSSDKPTTKFSLKIRNPFKNLFARRVSAPSSKTPSTPNDTTPATPTPKAAGNSKLALAKKMLNIFRVRAKTEPPTTPTDASAGTLPQRTSVQERKKSAAEETILLDGQTTPVAPQTLKATSPELDGEARRALVIQNFNIRAEKNRAAKNRVAKNVQGLFRMRAAKKSVAQLREAKAPTTPAPTLWAGKQRTRAALLEYYPRSAAAQSGSVSPSLPEIKSANSTQTPLAGTRPLQAPPAKKVTLTKKLKTTVQGVMARMTLQRGPSKGARAH